MFMVTPEEPTAPLAADPVAVLAAAAVAAIKTASPTVVEPRLVLAAAAVVAPVPPLATGRVPDTATATPPAEFVIEILEPAVSVAAE